MFTADANLVAVAAFPLVSTAPVVFTPGKSIAVDPSKETPPIFIGVVNLAADPDHVVDVNEPVVPPLGPTITSSTLISPEVSLITNLLATFPVAESTEIVVSPAPV